MLAAAPRLPLTYLSAQPVDAQDERQRLQPLRLGPPLAKALASPSLALRGGDDVV